MVRGENLLACLFSQPKRASLVLMFADSPLKSTIYIPKLLRRCDGGLAYRYKTQLGRTITRGNRIARTLIPGEYWSSIKMLQLPDHEVLRKKSLS